MIFHLPRLFRSFTTAIISLIIILGVSTGSVKGLAVDEVNLNPAGGAYEVNADASGILWLGDYGAGEIRAYDPQILKYEVFAVAGNPGDARQVGGNIWWVDQGTPLMGRMNRTSGAYTTWEVSTAYNLQGSAVDSLGRLWATEYYGSSLWRLDLSGVNPNLCQFTLPLDGSSNYVISDGGSNVWLGDFYNGRLLRLNISSGALKWWPLPGDPLMPAAPNGLVLDADGHIWYADTNLNEIAELDPNGTTIKRYEVPNGTIPWMLAVQNGKIWFTDQAGSAVGKLDPVSAAFSQFTSSPDATITLTPTCKRPASGPSGTLSHPPQPYSVAAFNYAESTPLTGLTMYSVPYPASSYLNGITTNGSIWFIDTGRAVLGNIPNASLAQLSLKKTASPLMYEAVGAVISYSCELKNTGEVTLSGPFTVSDNKTTDESCPGTASLAPGASITCSASYTVTQTDLDAGSVNNTATGHAVFDGSPVHSATDFATVNAVQSPALVIVKEANPTTYDSAGDEIGYSYVLTNTGNVTLAGPFTVTDNKAAATCPATASLTPGASINCTAAYSITPADITAGSVTNTASGHAMFGGSPVNSTSVEITVTRSQVEYKVFLPLILR